MTTGQSHEVEAETTPCDSGDRFLLWLDTYRRQLDDPHFGQELLAPSDDQPTRLTDLHRSTALIAPRGARYTIHVNFRASDADWIGRHSWSMASTEGPWVEFVCRASPRQLELFGFPPAGHTYWKPETLAGLALRHPESISHHGLWRPRPSVNEPPSLEPVAPRGSLAPARPVL
jgi:hypothetical protein